MDHRNHRARLHCRPRRRPQIMLRRWSLNLAMGMTRRRAMIVNLRQTPRETLGICERQRHREQNDNSGQRAPHMPSD